MKTTYLLIDLAIYAGLIPCVVVIYNRRFLKRAELFLGGELLLGTLIGIVSVWLAMRGTKNQFIYPVLALSISVLMGLFFAELARNGQVKCAIRLVFAAYAGYVLLTGFANIPLFMNLELFAPLDVAVFSLSLFFLVGLLRHSRRVAKKPLFWLLLAICAGSLYDMAVAQLSTLLTQYGGNRLKDLLWLQINPVVTIIRHGLYAYGFYVTRFQLIKSEKLPQFTP